MVGLTRRARLLARGNHALAVLVVETSLGSTARQALAARLLAVASSRHLGVSLSRHDAQVVGGGMYILRLLHSAQAWGVVILLLALAKLVDLSLSSSRGSDSDPAFRGATP